MRRTLTIAAVVALLAYGLWALLGGHHTTTSSASAPQASTQTASSAPTQAAPLATITPTATLPRGLSASTPDWTSVNKVAIWFTQRYYTLDTTIDTTPAMGPARAAQAATPTLASMLRITPTRTSPGAEWNTLAASHGWTITTASIITLANGPADTPTTCYRSVQAIVDRHTGDSFGTHSHLLALKLTRTHGQWRVASTQEVED